MTRTWRAGVVAISVRYKRAAAAALEQLDWCIRYLAGMRRSELSARLAKDRVQIKHNLMEDPTSSDPRRSMTR
jgi:hypothetical protein